MAKYRKISWKEYENFGNITVFASYPKNDIAKRFCCFVKKGINVASFNLRKSLKDNLEKELTNINDLTAFLYIDNTASSDIEYVCRKCYEIKRAIKKFVLILDFENQVPYTKKELEQLRGLSLYLDIHILITTDLASVKNKKYPALEDLDNADLVEIADKILLSNDEKSSGLVLAKNNFGKIGLLCND